MFVLLHSTHHVVYYKTPNGGSLYLSEAADFPVLTWWMLKHHATDARDSPQTLRRMLESQPLPDSQVSLAVEPGHGRGRTAP